MKPVAELMVLNAVVWTGARRSGGDAVAVADGRVIALGGAAELAPLRAPTTRVIDARGGTVTPGLTDAHLHLVAWARSRDEIDLQGAETRAEALARVARFAADRGPRETLVGRGWDAAGWTEPPDRAALDAVVADRPVLLHSRDYHNLWVNSAALRQAAVDRRSADPPGGWIDRDPTGEPTGLLREHAVALCAGLDPATGETDLERVRRAAGELLALGITAVHDFEGREAMRVLRALAGGPPPRVRVLMNLPRQGLDAAVELGLESGIGDRWFRLGALKLFADGTLGSRTAALLAPYEGTEDRGAELMTPRELEDTVRRALSHRLAVAIHAIGDRAARSALDAFASSRSALGRPALRSRLEHAQLLDPGDLGRFAALGVAASMQPVHCTSDRELAERWWGPRVAGAYAWKSLLESGALLAFGSDAPVEAPSAARGLHAAVTRERPGRPGPFVPEQRIDLDQALVAYTEGPARLSGDWPRRGRLAAGAVADLVVWNADLHRLPVAELWQARPAATVLEGVWVHGADREGRTPAPPEPVASHRPSGDR